MSTNPVVLMNVALVSGTERCRRHAVTDSLFITANIKPLLRIGGYDGAEVNGRKNRKSFTLLMENSRKNWVLFLFWKTVDFFSFLVFRKTYGIVFHYFPENQWIFFLPFTPAPS